MLKPLLAAVIMGLATYGVKLLLSGLTNSRLILCAAPIAVAVVVYLALVVVLKVVTYDDCMLLPKGEKIAKLLKITK